MRKLLLAVLVVLAVCAPAFPAGEVIFNNVEGMAVDQPRVAVEVYTLNPEHSLGPDISNFWLLDTGAQGILAAGSAVEEMSAAGYTTVNQFAELGAGGSTYYDVSALYQFDFAGTSGQRNALGDTRLLSSETANFGGFGGIVGMPAMVNRVTTLDMTAMVNPSLEMPYMGVAFDQSLPDGDAHRYNVPITLWDHPVSAGQINPGDELPTYAPIPFVDVTARNDGNNAGGSYILDTGAQMSMISTETALALGCDTNNNGVLDDDEILGQTAISGAGGTVYVPIVAVDQLRLTTVEGVDIVFENLGLLVLDIHPEIDGIFGSDLLTAGYLEGAFNTLMGLPGEKGFLDAVHFDFLNSSSGTGMMVLDINSAYDVVVPEPTTMAMLGFSIAFAFCRRLPARRRQ